jgi:hypothetical protein
MMKKTGIRYEGHAICKRKKECLFYSKKDLKTVPCHMGRKMKWQTSFAEPYQNNQSNQSSDSDG